MTATRRTADSAAPTLELSSLPCSTCAPEAGWGCHRTAKIAGALLDQRAGIGEIRYLETAQGLAVLNYRAVGRDLQSAGWLDIQASAGYRPHRVPFRGDQRSSRRHPKAPIARVQAPGRTIHREEAFARERQIQGAAGCAQRALRRNRSRDVRRPAEWPAIRSPYRWLPPIHKGCRTRGRSCSRRFPCWPDYSPAYPKTAMRACIPPAAAIVRVSIARSRRSFMQVESRRLAAQTEGLGVPRAGNFLAEKTRPSRSCQCPACNCLESSCGALDRRVHLFGT